MSLEKTSQLWMLIKKRGKHITNNYYIVKGYLTFKYIHQVEST